MILIVAIFRWSMIVGVSRQTPTKPQTGLFDMCHVMRGTGPPSPPLSSFEARSPGSASFQQRHVAEFQLQVLGAAAPSIPAPEAWLALVRQFLRNMLNPATP